MIEAVLAAAAGVVVAGKGAEVLILNRHQRRQPWRVLRLYVPTGHEVSGARLEELLTAVWGKFLRSRWAALRWGQRRLAFEIRADDRGVNHYWAVPAEEVKFLRALVATHLPGVYCDEAPEYMVVQPPEGRVLATLDLRPKRPAAYPLADFTKGFAESLAGQMEAGRSEGPMVVQILMRPVHDGDWKPRAREELLKAEGKAGRSAGADLLDGLKMLSPSAQPAAKPAPTSRLERLATKDTPAKLLGPAFDVQIRLMAAASTKAEAFSLVRRMAGTFAGINGTNHVESVEPWTAAESRRRWRQMALRWGPLSAGRLILSPAELTSLVNPVSPAPTTEEGVRVIELKRPPLKEGIYVCDAMYQGARVKVRMRPTDLDTHLGIFGKTGNGKGVIQENLFREMALECGGIYLDPLGGSVRKLLASLPEHRLDDVVYIEVGHPHWAVPLNILAGTDDVENRAADAVGLYYKLWSDAWGKSTEELLRASTMAITEVGGGLPEVELLLNNPAYRKSILHRITNPAIKNFLQTLPDKVTESIRPPLNKLHELLWQPSILAMLGQPDTLDWREIILKKRLVLVNLNKGEPKIGELGARLVAGIIWSRVQRAGLSIPVDQRQRFFQIADEFKDVASRTPEDFEMAFSQYRQFLLPVVAAGQYPRQLPEKLVDAMSGNVGSKLVLREDQPHSSDTTSFLGAGGLLADADLNNLPERVGYANLLVEKRPTGVFTCWAPPFSQRLRDPDEAAEYCLRRWARPRAQVLEEIDKRIRAASGGGQQPIK